MVLTTFTNEKMSKYKILFNNCFYFVFSVIEQEKGQQNIINGIENFDQKKLKHTETCEKNTLPTKDIIDQEKTA